MINQPEKHITSEMIDAMNVPDDLKQWMRGMIAIRPHCEQQRMGKAWLRLVQMVLLDLYGEFRSEWIQLFSNSTRKTRTSESKSFDDGFSHLLKRKDGSTFVAEKCEGCTTEQMEEWRRTGKVPTLAYK